MKQSFVKGLTAMGLYTENRGKNTVKESKGAWYLVAGTAFIAFIIFSVLRLWDCIVPVKRNNNDSLYNKEDIHSKMEENYAFETCYNGEPHLDDRLFWKPFGKSEEYISNNDLLAGIGADNAQLIVAKAKELSEYLFNTAYKEKVKEASALRLADCIVPGINLFFLDGRQAKGNTAAASAINQWFVSTQTSMEASLQTDKCLVYYDRHSIILRGLLTFSVYESDDMEAIKDSFNLEDLQYGKRYAVVTEMYFVPGGSIESYGDYRLARLEIL